MIRALIPAKTLGEAKGRLAAEFSEVERRQIALAMLEDVVRALTAVPAITSVSVVSPDNDVLELASSLGATPIAESANIRGINQALSRAISVMSPPPDALLVVLGDLPEIAPEEIERLLAALPERGVAAAPSLDGGTSALALRPPGVIELRFGDQSFAAHREAADRAGVGFREVPLASLSRDIDSPEDLRALRARPGTATGRLLERLGAGARLGRR